MLKKFSLKYGKSSLDFSFPETQVLGVLESKPFPVMPEVDSLVLGALEPLPGIVKKGETVAIVVSDRTRKTGAQVFLPVLINKLNEVGVPDKDIFIVLATGVHPKDSAEDKIKIVGEEIAKRVEIFDHDARDESNLVEVGTTKKGNRVKLNKMVVEADRKIITGSLSYHYFAGYGGGAKSILPGIAGYSSIVFNHNMSMSDECRTGRIDGNPLREDMEEAAQFLKPDFLLNTVVTPDNQIAAVFGGDIVKAHRKAADYLDDYRKIKVTGRADFIIASAGGWPKDLNFVQAHKGIENASYVLRPGGVLLFLGECAEGYPSPAYEQYINLGSPEAVEKSLGKEFYVSGHTVLSAFQKARKFKIIWVTKLGRESLKPMGIEAVLTLEEGLKQAKTYLKDGVKTYIIPEAASVFPVAES